MTGYLPTFKWIQSRAKAWYPFVHVGMAWNGELESVQLQFGILPYLNSILEYSNSNFKLDQFIFESNLNIFQFADVRSHGTEWIKSPAWFRTGCFRGTHSIVMRCSRSKYRSGLKANKPQVPSHLMQHLHLTRNIFLFPIQQPIFLENIHWVCSDWPGHF